MTTQFVFVVLIRSSNHKIRPISASLSSGPPANRGTVRDVGHVLALASQDETSAELDQRDEGVQILGVEPCIIISRTQTLGLAMFGKLS